LLKIRIARNNAALRNDVDQLALRIFKGGGRRNRALSADRRIAIRVILFGI